MFLVRKQGLLMLAGTLGFPGSNMIWSLMQHSVFVAKNIQEVLMAELISPDLLQHDIRPGTRLWIIKKDSLNMKIQSSIKQATLCG